MLTPEPPVKASALKRLASLEENLPSEADFVLLGDSLAAGWPSDLLAAVLPGASVLNLGLPGDRVQNTRWRLHRLAAGHLRPRHLLVLLGINNLADQDPPDCIAKGLAALIESARVLWENPAVILVTVPRRGPSPGSGESERVRLNARLASDLAETRSVRLLDADRALAAEQGEGASRESDGIHLSRHGYKLLSDALGAIIGN